MARKAVHRGLPAPPSTQRAGAAAATASRGQPVMVKEPAQRGARCAEMAGGTAAECAAVICCCPCGLINLLLLAVVRLPAGLCRRAMMKHKRKKRAAAAGAGKRKPEGLLVPRLGAAFDDDDASSHPSGSVMLSSVASEGWLVAASPSPEVAEMEKEMWSRFYSTGFWRSLSQREES